MPIKKVLSGGRVPVKIWTTDVDEKSEQQLQNIATLPFIHKHIAAMPDVHLGKGATVGSVIATRGAICPASVGVDLGCGMMAAKLNIAANDLPDSLGAMRSEFERRIPHGRTDNGGPRDRGAWHHIPKSQENWWALNGPPFDPRMSEVLYRHPKLLESKHNTPKHLGTLGTGNHFVELCLDLEGGVWIMLHSGSRGIGNRIGSYFIEKAKEDMKRWFINLPDQDLAYIPEGSENFEDYCAAVGWAQNYALQNREFMMMAAMDAVSYTLGRPIVAVERAINCHHNYVARENHYGENVLVTRKGAIRAREGDLGIIPGSMGAKSFIVRGKGNAESFHSCSHGAGRRMSRTEAHKRFTAADLARETAGIECRKDEGVVDEIPSAYKPIDEVMANQSDLVEVVAQLRQVMCVKG